MRRSFLSIAIVLAISSACTGRTEPPRLEPRSASSSSAVVGGVLDTTHGAVGFFTTAPLPGACPGTLITPSVVLTSAHCLARLAQRCVGGDQFLASTKGSQTVFHLSPTGDFSVANDTTYAIHDVAIAPNAYHPTYSDCFQTDPNSCAVENATNGTGTGIDGLNFGWDFGNDLALFVLEHPVPSASKDPQHGADPIRALTSLVDPVSRVPFDVASFGSGPLLIVSTQVDNERNGGTTGPRVSIEANFLGDSSTGWFPAACSPDDLRCLCGLVFPGSVYPIRSSPAVQAIRLSTIAGQTEGGDSGSALLANFDSEHQVPGLGGGPYVIGTDGGGYGGGGSFVHFSNTFGPAGPWIDSMTFDWDGDGTPNERDNCPASYNPDQANCNVDSEFARNAAVLGDACDPAPCPSSSIGDSTASVGGCFPIQGDPLGETCATRSIRDVVTSAPIGSRPVTGLIAFPGAAGSGAVVPAISSEFRFCQSDRHQNIKCVVDNAQLTLEPFPPSNDQPWHKISFGLSGTVPPPRGATLTWGYGSTLASNLWFFQTDSAFWLSDPANLRIAMPTGFPGCQTLAGGGTCLDGLFWIHGHSDVGSVTDVTTTGNGIHRRTDVVAAAPEALANTYFPVHPDMPLFYCRTRRPPASVGAALVSASTLGSAQLLWPSSGTLRTLDTQPAVQTVLVLPSARGLVGSLEPSGSMIALSNDGESDCSGDSVTTLLADELQSLVWSSAVEPNILIGGGAFSDVLALGISRDGTTVVGTAIAVNSQLDFSQSVQPVGGPSPRSTFRSVFSRAASGLFVLGGTSSTGATLHDIWFSTMSGDWSELSFDAYAPGRVLDATYTFANPKLVVLDEVPGHERRVPHVRLARLDTLSRNAQTVFTARREHPERTPFLAIDRDGGLLVALSGTKKTRVVRLAFTADDRPVVTRLRGVRGALARAPIVDPNGYSFVIAAPDGRLSIDRRSKLVARSCGDDDDDDRDDGRAEHGHRPDACPLTVLEELF